MSSGLDSSAVAFSWGEFDFSSASPSSLSASKNMRKSTGGGGGSWEDMRKEVSGAEHPELANRIVRDEQERGEEKKIDDSSTGAPLLTHGHVTHQHTHKKKCEMDQESA